MDERMNGRATRTSALVTGAGKRIGRAVAEALIERRVATVLHYRSSREGAEEVLAQAEKRGVPATAIQAELTEPAEAERLWREAVEALGPIDWLVNNASLFEPLSAFDTSLEAWQRNHHIHSTAPFLLSRLLAQQPPRDDDTPRAIVNMLDYRAVQPRDDHFPYTISKAALVAQTLSLAQAFAPHVRVNGIALGNILPPVDGSEEHNPPTFRRTPMKRRGTVEETVESVLFQLAGPAFLTGDILYLTGGRHLT